MKSKRIAVVGSEGYIGKKLLTNLFYRDTALLSIDAGFYGQPLGKDTVRVSTKDDILSALNYFQPDTIIWLAGLPHDPGGIRQGAILKHTYEIPIDVLREQTCQVIVASSMAVFNKTKNTPPYIAAKRLLEDALWRSKNWRNTHILRFGTVCGPGHPSTHRVHLLLNKMVHDALMKKEITVNGPGLERPVLGIKGAIRAICNAIDEGPGSTVGNYYWCSGTLLQYARAVQRILELEGYRSPQICLKNPVDKRSYGWDSFGIESANIIIHELVHFYSEYQEFPDYYGELRERFGI